MNGGVNLRILFCKNENNKQTIISSPNDKTKWNYNVCNDESICSSELSFAKMKNWNSVWFSCPNFIIKAMSFIVLVNIKPKRNIRYYLSKNERFQSFSQKLIFNTHIPIKHNNLTVTVFVLGFTIIWTWLPVFQVSAL